MASILSRPQCVKDCLWPLLLGRLARDWLNDHWKTNGRLANRELASLVREATGSNNAKRASTITLIIVRIVCGVC